MRPSMQPQSDAIDQILEEHQQLRHRLSEVRAFLQRPRPRPAETGAQTWSSTLEQMLGDLHDRLFRHFQNEEQDDSFSSLAERRSWSWGTVQDLLAEHGALLEELNGVIEATVGYSTATDAEDRRIRRRMRRMLSHLESHEQRETDLLQRLYYDDLGVGD